MIIKGVRSGRTNLELRKIRSEIDRHGNMYFVFRKELDEYKEETDKTKAVDCIKGLFHVTKEYISRTIDDGTNVRVKGQPMLLVLWEDVCNIMVGDIIRINNNKYVVNHINNIEEMNIVCDISLEVVLNGSS